jgi:hypothetical protein
LNYFAELGGFEALIHLLKLGNTRRPVSEEADQNAEKGENKKDNQAELMPLEFLGDLTGAFLNARLLMSEEFAAKFVDEVSAIVNERLMGMTDKEIKELDKEGLPDVLASYRTFLALAKDDGETAKQIEEMQLSLAVRFLKTTYLEKRLKGVGDLRHLVEKVHARAVLQRSRQKALDMKV